jgi:hypothetical protein
LAVFAKSVNIFEGFYERVLQDIIRIIMVNYDSSDMPVQSLLVCVDKFAEREIPRRWVSECSD